MQTGQIRSIVYRELFQFFTSRRADGRPGVASARDLPRPLSRSLVHLYALIRKRTIALVDTDLADQIASALSQWSAELWVELDRSAETDDSAEWSGDAPFDGRLASVRRLWPEHELKWTLIEERHRSARGDAGRGAIAHELERSVTALNKTRRERSQERALRLVATPLADHLNEVIPRLAAAQEACRRNFLRACSWDLFDDSWSTPDWSVFDRARDVLERDPGLAALSQMISRGAAGDEPRLVWRTIRTPELIHRDVDVGLGDVLGVNGRGDLRSALGSELALLAWPETEDLFARKLAEREIMSLEYRRTRTQTIERERWARVQLPAPVRPGPLIVCLDTSGSMQGLPERIARAISLGLVREAIGNRRDLRLLAIQRGLKEVHVPGVERTSVSYHSADTVVGEAPSRVDESVLRELQTFLSAPMGGGSDISPTLGTALGHLPRGEDEVADVVMVSDIRFPKIGPSHLRTMYELQQRGLARFHALTINALPIEDPLNLFDYRWHYNTSPRPDLVGAPSDDENSPIGLDFHAFRGA
ncbi:MAG: hypothetical protein MI724_09415 [Spirochaetales bacterium]|nr:hypothetical protein [Spirochaetales bacterium]